MRKSLAILFVLSSLGVGCYADFCDGDYVVYGDEAMPPNAPEATNGYWRWTEHGYVWVNNALWVPGHWNHGGLGDEWVEGHWHRASFESPLVDRDDR